MRIKPWLEHLKSADLDLHIICVGVAHPAIMQLVIE